MVDLVDPPVQGSGGERFPAAWTDRGARGGTRAPRCWVSRATSSPTKGTPMPSQVLANRGATASAVRRFEDKLAHACQPPTVTITQARACAGPHD